MRLRHARVLRGGVKAAQWHQESTECRFEINQGVGTLRFDLASKGGGRTDVGVFVDERDWPVILSQSAQQVPGAMLMLAEATRQAALHNEEELHKFHSTLAGVSEALEEWDHAANKRYDAAPYDNDAEEAAEMNRASDAALAAGDAEEILASLVRPPASEE